MIIHHPLLGPRDAQEFTYLGDASLIDRPDWRAEDTVDRFQGSEREAMILSFTASDPAFIEQQGDFLFQPQRLNVAVTRARSKRLLILSESLVETATALAAAGHQAAGLLISLIEESDDGLA